MAFPLQTDEINWVFKHSLKKAVRTQKGQTAKHITGKIS
ncbi:hypothetical protein NMA510612_0396 [Neisseria meningitidis]|uniref:Uncharacterized protein n=1 Tax=Neisseria meningitidis TaxID=487 RepID=X5F460_NEIME|nr:hypothetical protein NMA510612_0396 [Neisseria meningitidis]